ncbi:MAG: hypothetical protein ACOYJE_03625 [Bacteroidaceae bacterium]
MNTLDTNSIERLTFEEICRMKEETLKDINQQKENISKKSKQLFSHASFIPGSSLLGNLKFGYTLFTGAMVGFKIIRSIKRFFRR